MDVEQQHSAAGDEVGHYDRSYSRHLSEGGVCKVSCGDQAKAERRIRWAARTFDLGSLDGARVLDVGCGLGYFAEALRALGARVRAIDSSSVAIDAVRARFPEVDAIVGKFPDDCPPDEHYDLIWTNDFPLLNTFDVDYLSRAFIRPALARLVEGGSLIIGTHTNFDGTLGSSNWANWSMPMIETLKASERLEGPRVVSIDGRLASRLAMLLGRLLRKRVPIALRRVR